MTKNCVWRGIFFKKENVTLLNWFRWKLTTIKITNDLKFSTKNLLNIKSYPKGNIYVPKTFVWISVKQENFGKRFWRKIVWWCLCFQFNTKKQRAHMINWGDILVFVQWRPAIMIIQRYKWKEEKKKTVGNQIHIHTYTHQYIFSTIFRCSHKYTDTQT